MTKKRTPQPKCTRDCGASGYNVGARQMFNFIVLM